MNKVDPLGACAIVLFLYFIISFIIWIVLFVYANDYWCQHEALQKVCVNYKDVVLTSDDDTTPTVPLLDVCLKPCEYFFAEADILIEGTYGDLTGATGITGVTNCDLTCKNGSYTKAYLQMQRLKDGTIVTHPTFTDGVQITDQFPMPQTANDPFNISPQLSFNTSLTGTDETSCRPMRVRLEAHPFLVAGVSEQSPPDEFTFCKFHARVLLRNIHGCASAPHVKCILPAELPAV